MHKGFPGPHTGRSITRHCLSLEPRHIIGPQLQSPEQQAGYHEESADFRWSFSLVRGIHAAAASHHSREGTSPLILAGWLLKSRNFPSTLGTRGQLLSARTRVEMNCVFGSMHVTRVPVLAGATVPSKGLVTTGNARHCWLSPGIKVAAHHQQVMPADCWLPL